jgi:hypothetical protein
MRTEHARETRRGACSRPELHAECFTCCSIGSVTLREERVGKRRAEGSIWTMEMKGNHTVRNFILRVFTKYRVIR